MSCEPGGPQDEVVVSLFEVEHTPQSVQVGVTCGHVDTQLRHTNITKEGAESPRILQAFRSFLGSRRLS